MSLFVRIFVTMSFNFSVSNLTVLQSWFLGEGHVVFFSDIILFNISPFNFFLRLCIGVYWSLSSRGWFWLGISGFLVFNVSVTVDMFAYVFVGGFPVFQGQKTSHSLLSSERAFGLLNLENSVQISIIFSIPSFCRVALIMTDFF